MKSFFLSLIFFSFIIAGQAQDTTSLEKNTPTFHFSTGQYLTSYWTNGTALLISPLHWKGKDWAIAGGTVAVTTGLYFLDNEINRPFSRWQNGFGRNFGKGGNAVGPSVLMGSSLLVLGAGIVAKSQPLTDFAADNLQAQLFTSAITVVVKEILGRARPNQLRGAAYFEGPLPNNDGFTSFFSGHSSVAFATATTVFLHSHKKWWVGLISYGTASAIAVSRMQQQKHWGSDVLFGAVTGTAVSSFIYHQNEKKRKTFAPKQLL